MIAPERVEDRDLARKRGQDRGLHGFAPAKGVLAFLPRQRAREYFAE
jgi:hypothetical protein